jgi:hypothetical protein
LLYLITVRRQNDIHGMKIATACRHEPARCRTKCDEVIADLCTSGHYHTSHRRQATRSAEQRLRSSIGHSPLPSSNNSTGGASKIRKIRRRTICVVRSTNALWLPTIAERTLCSSKARCMERTRYRTEPFARQTFDPINGSFGLATPVWPCC